MKKSEQKPKAKLGVHDQLRKELLTPISQPKPKKPKSKPNPKEAEEE